MSLRRKMRRGRMGNPVAGQYQAATSGQYCHKLYTPCPPGYECVAPAGSPGSHGSCRKILIVDPWANQGAADGAITSFDPMLSQAAVPAAMPAAFAHRQPADCVAYIDEQSVMLFWKPGQPKPFVLPVTVVECDTGPSGTQCHVTAPPSAQAPDGIDRWLPRCPGYDQATKHEDCLAYIDGQSVMLFWKPGQQKPFVLPVTVHACSTAIGGTVCHVTAPESMQAPDGVDRWLPRCEELDQRSGRPTIPATPWYPTISSYPR